jgi:hypothetical protein
MRELMALIAIASELVYVWGRKVNDDDDEEEVFHVSSQRLYALL